MKRILMIDGHAILYRAYYTFYKRPMVNSKGIDTSAVFGFCKTIFDLMLKQEYEGMIVAFDPHGGTFRNQLYPQYKANREETPHVIRESTPIVIDILKACSIPIYTIDGYEADDVIGTLSLQAEESGYEVYMVTQDKDYGQLVTDNIKILRPARSGGDWELLGKDEICNKYGISTPLSVIDILTLWGDSSDNVPGVEGVGEVSAKKLIGKYATTECLLENLASLPQKMAAKLEASREQIALSKKLVTIERHVPVTFSPNDAAIKATQLVTLQQLFEKYELNSFIKQMPAFAERLKCPLPTKEQLVAEQVEIEDNNLPTIEPITTFCHYTDKAKAKEFLYKAKGVKILGIFPLSINGNDTLTAIALNCNEDSLIASPNCPLIKDLFADSTIAKCCYGIKPLLRELQPYGIEICGELFDAELMHYVLSPESSHKAEILAKTYLRYKLPECPPSAPLSLFADSEELLFWERDSHIPLKLYGVEMARAYLLLKEPLEEKLKESGMWELYLNIEMPLIGVLADMEKAGFNIDRNFIANYGVQLKEEAKTMEQKVREFAGKPQLNLSSPKQLGIYLYEELKIDGGKRQQQGKDNYPTDEETLNQFMEQYPILGDILEYRSLKKLCSSYTDSLPQLADPLTGRIHTTFAQSVTATGRLSSLKPNLQNIPVRDQRGRELRKAFIPSKGNILLSADYSQIELRIMAHLSQDAGLVAAFNNNEDVHASTAAKIYGKSIEQVTADERRMAKTANFGIIYGISPFGLAQRLNIGRREAKELIDDYYTHYPKVKEYVTKTLEKAKEYGYVETIFHRKRFIPEINSNNSLVRGLAERNAINAPVQGSAADIIKVAMINIFNSFKEQGLKSKMILQVHDELLFDVVPQEKEIVEKIVTDKMEHAAHLMVPLEVSMGFGANWSEAH